MNFIIAWLTVASGAHGVIITPLPVGVTCQESRAEASARLPAGAIVVCGNTQNIRIALDFAQCGTLLEHTDEYDAYDCLKGPK